MHESVSVTLLNASERPSRGAVGQRRLAPEGTVACAAEAMALDGTLLRVAGIIAMCQARAHVQGRCSPFHTAQPPTSPGYSPGYLAPNSAIPKASIRYRERTSPDYSPTAAGKVPIFGQLLPGQS